MSDLNYHKTSFLLKLKKVIALTANKFSFFTKKTKSGDTIDKKLIFSLNKSKIPSLNQLKYIGHFLSKKEKLIIRITLLLIIISGAFLAINLYKNHIVLAPARGGEYIEGLTGTPKFINPLYSSINTVDSDIASLVYSGLLKKNKDNKIEPDLAETFEVSADELVYTFYLKKNILWHNNNPFNADDVIFTFDAIVNSEYNSPLRISFEGIKVEKIDDYTIKFILTETYSAFLELLTIGIMPAEIWQQIPPQAVPLADSNIKPIGTGPYIFDSLTKDKSGNIRSYTLKANENYFTQIPYITKISFKFNPNFQEGINALNEGRIEGVDYLPKEIANEIITKNNFNQYFLQQPQFSALFFNQNNLGYLTDVKVKQALAHALDKKTYISASGEYSSVIDGPILPIFSEYYQSDIKRYDFNIEKSKELLDDAGWKVTEIFPQETNGEEEATTTSEKIEPGLWRTKGGKILEIAITTVEQEETLQLAEYIKKSWENLNIKVNLITVPAQLAQTQIIKPRDYQILLYGVVLGSDPDQYPFWHSSQISANGLNLSNYNNKQIDELLEDGRITNNVDIRKEKYKKFQEIIIDDLPAIFLFSQKYPYLQTNKIKGFDTINITVPSDRFNNITNWYIKTKKKFVWQK